MEQAGFQDLGVGNAAVWVDPEGIDPKSWLSVPLHQPASRGSTELFRRGSSKARLAGWPLGFSGEETIGEKLSEPETVGSHIEEPLSNQRVIPADCVRRLPIERARVTRLPPRVVGVARPRRRLFLLSPPTYEQRRGRAAAWGLLVMWLIGTWGTFYGLTGGLKSHEKSKAIVSSSNWGW